MATSNSQSSQSVTSAYIVRRAFTGLLSDGAQLGGGVIFILVSSVHCQSLLTLICSQFAMFNLPAYNYNRRSNRRFYRGAAACRSNQLFTPAVEPPVLGTAG